MPHSPRPLSQTWRCGLLLPTPALLQQPEPVPLPTLHLCQHPCPACNSSTPPGFCLCTPFPTIPSFPSHSLLSGCFQPPGCTPNMDTRHSFSLAPRGSSEFQTHHPPDPRFTLDSPPVPSPSPALPASHSGLTCCCPWAFSVPLRFPSAGSCLFQACLISPRLLPTSSPGGGLAVLANVVSPSLSGPLPAECHPHPTAHPFV